MIAPVCDYYPENEEVFLLTTPISFCGRGEDRGWGDAAPVGGETRGASMRFGADIRLTAWVVALADMWQSYVSWPDATCVSLWNCDKIKEIKLEASYAWYLMLAALVFLYHLSQNCLYFSDIRHTNNYVLGLNCFYQFYLFFVLISNVVNFFWIDFSFNSTQRKQEDRLSGRTVSICF